MALSLDWKRVVAENNEIKSLKIELAQCRRQVDDLRSYKQWYLDLKIAEAKKAKENSDKNVPKDCNLCKEYIQDIRNKVDRINRKNASITKLQKDLAEEQKKGGEQTKELEQMSNLLKKTNSELEMARADISKKQKEIKEFEQLISSHKESELQKDENIQELEQEMKKLENHIQSQNETIVLQQACLSEYEEKESNAVEVSEDKYLLQTLQERNAQLKQKEKQLKEAEELLKGQQKIIIENGEKIATLEKRTKPIIKIEEIVTTLASDLAQVSKQQEKMNQFVENVKVLCQWNENDDCLLDDQLDDLLAHLNSKLVWAQMHDDQMKKVENLWNPQEDGKIHFEIDQTKAQCPKAEQQYAPQETANVPLEQLPTQSQQALKSVKKTIAKKKSPKKERKFVQFVEPKNATGQIQKNSDENKSLGQTEITTEAAATPIQVQPPREDLKAAQDELMDTEDEFVDVETVECPGPITSAKDASQVPNYPVKFVYLPRNACQNTKAVAITPFQALMPILKQRGLGVGNIQCKDNTK